MYELCEIKFWYWFQPYELRWNFKRNTYIFIHENAFENVYEMGSILSRPQYVNDAQVRDHEHHRGNDNHLRQGDLGTRLST